MTMKNRTGQADSLRIKSGWVAFGKYREIFLDRHFSDPDCLTSNGIWMPKMISYKSIYKDT